MTQKFFFGALPALFALILASACAGAPRTVESESSAAVVTPAPALAVTVEPDPVVEPAPDDESARNLDAALAGLEQARMMAHDFGGPEFLAEDCAAADTRYDDVMDRSARIKTTEEALDLTESAGELTALYGDIFRFALPAFAEARAEEIIAAREEAIFVGIEAYSPDRLDAADDTSEDALRAYQEREDYYAAKNAAAQALLMYQALALGAEAQNEAYEIMFYQFEDIDPEEFGRAGELLDQGLQAFDSGDLEGAMAAGEESRGIYEDLLNRGMQSYADERRQSAEEERRFAEEHKANVAVRMDFENAQRIFGLGEMACDQGQYREAANLFFQAEFSFAAAASVAEAKRLRALETIRRAEEQAITSDNTARSAETITSRGTER